MEGALGERIRQIVHELNQPLAGILANAGAAKRILGRDEVDLSAVVEVMEDIISDNKRAAGIVRNLGSMAPHDAEESES